jgi:hypothetical protein
MPRPLCFMIMPYGRKATQAEAGMGPSEVDFNALWDRAYVPVIKALGYEPIRADQDTGTLIITQMLERLYFADLVLADLTIGNGNVYYEVGIRHAAQKQGCVLLAADWSKQLFDVAQMRTIRYPLPEGNILPGTAMAIQRMMQAPIAALANGLSPMHAAIKGYPDQVDPLATSTMEEYLRDLAELQGSIRAIRALPMARRMVEAQGLAQTHGSLLIRPAVAIALVRMLREAVNEPEDWSGVIDFIDTLPKELVGEAEFREHRAFALSNMGQHVASIAELETLIDRFGPTPERLGLLGGRYKRLIKSVAGAERARLLNLAISAYQRGMDLDLNEYYCSSNLPRLYRERNRKGDESRAQLVLSQVIMACERAVERGASDEWLRPTLLTAAFDAADADKAEEIAEAMDLNGAAPYKLDVILGDLKSSAAVVVDPERQKRLYDVVERLSVYLAGS